MEWIKVNHWEIRQSKALKLLGAILGLIHILIYFQWRPIVTRLAEDDFPLCWDMIASCHQWQDFFGSQATIWLKGYLVISCISLLCFAFQRLIGFSWWLLIITWVMQVTVYLSYSELAANIYGFLFIFELCFLFALQKKRTALFLILSFYLYSGYLKLNTNWLAGYWLSNHLDSLKHFGEVPGKGIEWLAVFSTLIEMVAPLGLLSKVGQRFALAVLALTVYHIAQWLLMGPFLPLVQMGLLFFAIIYHIEVRKKERAYIYQSYIRPEPSKNWVIASLALFWTIQLLPIWNTQVIPKNFPLRMVSHKIPTQCQQHNLAIYSDITKDITNMDLMANRSCNTQVQFYQTKKICKNYLGKDGFKALSSFFIRKKTSEKQFHRIYEERDICTLESPRGNNQ